MTDERKRAVLPMAENLAYYYSKVFVARHDDLAWGVVAIAELGDSAGIGQSDEA